MSINIQNNYVNFKSDFKEDTGLDADKNIDQYLLYYNARVNDYSYQIIHGLTTKLINSLDHLPSIISLRIGEMLKDHPNFK